MTTKLFLVGLGLFACSTHAARIDVLKNRAAFDFNCPREQLVVTDLGGNNMMGVEGCGRRATYVANAACGGGNPADVCTWIMNTDEKLAGNAEAPPPASPAPAPASTAAPAAAQ
jgi:hypothetical protein